MRKKIEMVFVLGTVSLVLIGCAKNPDKIQGTYVSASTYSHLSCQQMVEERNALVNKVNELSGAQRKEATEDAVATGVAIVLFWPAALFLADGGGNETQIANLKGHYEAITIAFDKKGCKAVR